MLLVGLQQPLARFLPLISLRNLRDEKPDSQLTACMKNSRKLQQTVTKWKTFLG